MGAESPGARTATESALKSKMVVGAFVNSDVFVLVLLLLYHIYGQNSEVRCCGWHWKVTFWVSCRAGPKLGEILDLLYCALVSVFLLFEGMEWLVGESPCLLNLKSK